MRARFAWSIGRRTLALGERTLVMGILNVTPDSFSDGGEHLAPECAVEHGLRLLDEGADILDIGGESTRPGTPTVMASEAANDGGGTSNASGAKDANANVADAAAGAQTAETSAQPVSAEAELARVLPVIERLRRLRPNAVLSIDTYKAAVARQALAAGVEIVNDVSGLAWDPAMASTVAAARCGVVLMHTRGRPHQWPTLPPLADPVALVLRELRARLDEAIAAGIAAESIVLDPGFGFGKRGEENLALLAHFAELQALGRPLLAGVSRKGFLRMVLETRMREIVAGATAVVRGDPTSAESGRCGAPSGEASLAACDVATIAASVAAVLAGAHIVRVHAVRRTVEALAVADALLAAK